MKPEPENFDALLQVLALKRHEQPPPGYFENFSRAVIVRLQSGEVRKRGWWHDIVDEAPWLRPILAAFEARPLLAGAFGVVVCVLVLSGITYSQKMDRPTLAASSPLNPNPGERLFNESAIPDGTTALTVGEPASVPALMVTSTNPVIDPQIPAAVLELFRPTARPVPANFNP